MKDQVEDKAAVVAGEPGLDGARKLYATPKLRRLGSVRELTFGSAGGAPDAPGMMAM